MASQLAMAEDEIARLDIEPGPIPRLIHMTARSRHLGGPLEQNLRRIRRLNPRWDLHLYDDDEVKAFIQGTYGPGTAAVYSRINPKYGAARADLFRYLCMLRCGGVYLDLKSTTSQPLDEWITPDDQYILSQWDNGPAGRHPGWGLHRPLAHIPGGEFQQWFIIAAPGHPFLRAAAKAVVRAIAHYRPIPPLYGTPGVRRLTGPIPYTLAIHPLLAEHPARRVDVEAEGYLRYTVLQDWHAHRASHLEGIHYSQLREPIVLLGRVDALQFAVARAAREAVQSVNRRIRSFRQRT